MLIQPFLSNDDFLADVIAAREQADRFHLWWLGQSGYVIHWQNRHLLIDPYLSDSLTKKYAQTDKPHIRLSERVIAPEQLNFIDVITSSHNHTDHLDAETIVPLREANLNLQMIVPEANRQFAAQRFGCDEDWFIGSDVNIALTVAEFTMTGVPAAHETLAQDDKGHYKFLGYIIQFGNWTIYHSGDTVWYEGMVEVLRHWSIDVAILPINGKKPERRVAGNLNGQEAVNLAKKIGARLVIPCHYDMFAFNTVSPDAFVQEAIRQQQRYQVLQLGERWSSVTL